MLHKLHRALNGVTTTTTAIILLCSVASAKPITPWLSPLENLADTLLVEGTLSMDLGSSPRPDVGNIGKFVAECRGFGGRQNPAAEWSRAVFHDGSTHNVDDGTGGIDASIFLELGRQENVGEGLRNTMNDFHTVFGLRYLSKADILALGLVMAVVECGGPMIPFQAGRIDAVAPGRSGVPVPHQPLKDHTEAFRKMGFTQVEMIGLTACGHTMGSVHNSSFPMILVQPEVVCSDSHTPFDTTVEFDVNVVTEYLNGTTRNPLVVSRNATFRSDLRIFESDGNKTMTSLASKDTFFDTCQTLFHRLINLVPKGVQLTEVIPPFIPDKVGVAELTVGMEALELFTSVRLLHGNRAQNVTLHWEDKDGGCCQEPCSSPSFHSGQQSVLDFPRRLGFKPVTHFFNTSINATSSISKFWFQVDEDCGPTRIIDNGGAGFEIQDLVLYAPLESTRVVHNSTETTALSLAVAVKEDQDPSKLFIEYLMRKNQTEGVPDSVETFELQLDPEVPPRFGYKFYRTTSKIDAMVHDVYFELHGVFEDGTYTEYLRRSNLAVLVEEEEE